MAIEIAAYLMLTLICLRVIHISGPPRSVNNKKVQYATTLLENLKQRPEYNDTVKYYNEGWEDSNGHPYVMDAYFVSYTLMVLSRRRAYLLAYFFTYAVTILFMLTLLRKCIFP